jgi:glycosyltransferase involved in cell wall biosynthesis
MPTLQAYENPPSVNPPVPGACSRVLVVGPSPPPYNGMSVATNLVLNGLNGRLPIVHLDTADRRDLSNLGKLDWTNVRLAVWHGLNCLFLLLWRQPSIVYVPISQAMLPFFRDCLFLIPARLLKKTVVIHLHGSYFHEFYRRSSGPMRRLIRFALRNVYRAIVLGDSLVGVFDGIVPRDRITVVPNGIPDYLDGDSGLRTLQRPPRVLFLATHVAEKGIFDVLRAVPSVLDAVGDCTFTFAGEWYRSKEKTEAERLVRELGIDGHVEFTGPVGPGVKERLFLSSDAFVFPPTHYEGLPFVILEAMCAGLPVVTTTTGCIKETVQDGVTGFIVPKSDPNAVATAIIRLLKDENLRMRMGTAARDRFLSLYTSEKFIDRLESVFLEASAVA